ncbi:MAG: hypothetical protein R6V12_12520 [Candidatus Hydrogenedentota bacterium]
MIRRYHKLSLAWAIPGAVLQGLGGLFQASFHMWAPPNSGTAFGFHMVLLGALLLLMGCAQYAKSKGRSTAWCLFALLGIPGWIILVTILANLEDLAPETGTKTSQQEGP